MAPKHLDITIVVNGQPVVVSANPHSPLRAVIPKALEETGNLGQPPENWELRDAGGTLLDTSQKIESFSFAHDVRLFLSLKAGVGGA
ncbi:MAG: DUF2604 domain-containing protein [Solirubrobacteraceae bacterium]